VGFWELALAVFEYRRMVKMIGRNDGRVVLNQFFETTGIKSRIGAVESELTLGLLPFRAHKLDLGGVMTRTK
jgi:hypothetical protein